MSRHWNFWLGLILSLLPVGIAVYYATAYSFGYMDVFDPGFKVEHWRETLADPLLGSTLWFSFKNSILSLTITLNLAFWIASRDYYSEDRSLSLMYYIPLAIPPIMAAFLGFQWLNGGGWLSRIAYHLGWIHSIQEFPDLIYTSTGIGIILIHGLLLIPFFTILIYNFYRQERIRSLQELSRNLGVSPMYFFRKVSLPIISKKVLPIAGLYLILLMGSYEVPLLIGGQHPKMLSIYIIENLQRFDLSNIPQAYAVSLLFFIAVGLIIFFIPRLLPKNVMQKL